MFAIQYSQWPNLKIQAGPVSQKFEVSNGRAKIINKRELKPTRCHDPDFRMGQVKVIMMQEIMRFRDCVRSQGAYFEGD